MNTEENKILLIKRINDLQDEALIDSLLKIIDRTIERPSIEQIFDEGKEQYGDTLKKLAD